MPSIALDKAEQRGFERGFEQGFVQGFSQKFAQGFSRGLEIGFKRGIEKVAVNMLNNGNSFEEIQSITELSLERIRQLAEDLKADYIS